MRQRKSETIFYYDRWLLFVVFALIAIGLIMVTSASMVVSDQQFGYPFHFFLKQMVYLTCSCIAAFILLRVELETWYRISPYLLILSFLLLVLVLIPGVGHQINGSKRWLRLGPISGQVSELVKMGLIMYLASYLVRQNDEVRTRVSGFIKPMIILAAASCLLLLEPDFGAMTVIMVTALGMMFLSGMRLWQFMVLFVIVAVALALFAVSAPYRMQRLTTFLHPWATQFGSGYQLTQSLIAFGRGGIFGVGLGNSIQKLFYLPEAYSDFLFAVLGEELGLIGELVVVSLFVIIVARALIIGRQAQKIGRLFPAFLAYGFGLWIGLQALINIGVNMGVLPTKGLTLPFMSYGGSSLLANCMTVAILMAISNEIKQVRPLPKPIIRKRNVVVRRR